MTTSSDASDVVTLETLDRRIDELTDLFRRRLTDDRLKSTMLDELRVRSEFIDRGLEAVTVLPLSIALIRLIDRIETYVRGGHDQGSPDFLQSVADEIIDALELVGVNEVEYVELDPRVHRVVKLEGDAGEGRTVAAVIRRGYVRGDRIVRTADVVAQRGDALAPVASP